MDRETEQSGTVARDAGGRKRFRIPLRIIAVLILLALADFACVEILSAPYDRTHATYSNFVIEEGDNASDVAAKLEDAGLVKSAARFKFVSRLTFAGNFRPGMYFLSPSMKSTAIINSFTKGLTTSRGFTLPAGYTVEQTAAALDRDGLADMDSFMKAASSPYLADIEILADESGKLKGSELVEGFLFPAEYSLSDEADESMMIVMMIDAFSNFFNDDYRARTEELGMSVREIIVIASLIEKETSVDKERAEISAVLHNRINLEMTEKGEIPDVPVCSPSKESVIAALYPEENENTYYVLSSKLNGSHVFTADEEEYRALLEEYNEAVQARNLEDEEDKNETGDGGE